MEKFNGWTNYSTWRVNLEMFDGYEGTLSADTAREIVEGLRCRVVRMGVVVCMIGHGVSFCRRRSG